jgi:hypothetical protein
LETDTRVETVRQFILSGDEASDIVRRAAETWGIKQRQAENYIHMARAKIRAITEQVRPYLLAEHIAVRRDIRRRAREAGDLRAEIAAAQDEAKLFGLYPSERVEVLTWEDKVIRLLMEGKVTPDEVMAEFGDDLAANLFKRAGVPLSAGSAAGTASQTPGNS